MREFVAAKPVPVTIGDQEYFILFNFGKIKRIQERLKVDLLSNADVKLDVFTKVLFMGLVHPGELTEESLDELIDVRQLPYYVQQLQLAINIQTQPDEPTKNVSPASSPNAAGSGKKRAPKKQNSGSGQLPLASGQSPTQPSGN